MNSRRKNGTYHEAQEFCPHVGIPTLLVGDQVSSGVFRSSFPAQSITLPNLRLSTARPHTTILVRNLANLPPSHDRARQEADSWQMTERKILRRLGRPEVGVVVYFPHGKQEHNLEASWPAHDDKQLNFALECQGDRLYRGILVFSRPGATPSTVGIVFVALLDSRDLLSEWTCIIVEASRLEGVAGNDSELRRLSRDAAAGIDDWTRRAEGGKGPRYRVELGNETYSVRLIDHGEVDGHASVSYGKEHVIMAQVEFLIS
ncbi:hypothetical protein B0T26DRAFT_195611 [Lasiosphaeria miniovina]|uniref:Uncharacterized protein n=1 Tax=Lasiosphaeria miniovina TaxID=1954250 RepID=A0AA40ATT8_9PEZI|nr:uncharacterized protein B0T26DRAFT_195611 [Lasiosphaeria miniovina]KAK0721890.1 hypothetical protein B0T26DRAFT_195611 [Lasiosphaeria miniovina]